MKVELDWSAYENAGLGDAYADIPKQGGDYAKAVAVCINSMVCLRPIEKGVMCPSFRVHNDAAYSPGGRSRLLKKKLNDEIGEEEQALLDRVMDACVSCKGCKRECDTNLDMATIRVEYLAQRYRERPVGIREQLFANLPNLLKHARVMRAAIGLLNRIPFLLKTLRLDPNHPLPLPQSTPKLTPKPDQIEGQGEVLLWVDSFTRYYAPGSAEAAVRVLEAAGLGVSLLETDLCGGRSAYSQGMIEKARGQARVLLEALRPHIEEGRTIIGLEPSTLLMLRDELGTLGLGDLAQRAGQSALLFEEFLAREIAANRLKLPLRSAANDLPVLVHGHCHQKAVGAMKAVRKVLKLIPDLQFDFIDASCCGGAGSFGFEVEHADDSRKMAELALIPALSRQPDARLIANGFSCREQVSRLGGPQGIHLAQLLAEYLV